MTTALYQQPQSKLRRLTYKQDKFISCKDEFVCFKGTFGCGKSLAMLIAAAIECETHPENLAILIRKEYLDLKNSTMRDWYNEFGNKYPITGNEVRFPNGSILLFLHGDDLNAIKNINAGFVGMIQAEEMTEDDFWFLKGRLRRAEGTRQLRLECNYDGHNWIYKLFDQQKIGTLITTNTFDNKENLPDDYIPGLMKLPKKLQERYLYGSDADMEGLIWDEFSMSKNVIEPFAIPTGWDCMVSLDHGFTNPTAVLWCAIDWDGNLYIYDEHYRAGRLISFHAEMIKQRDNSQVKTWLIDPSTMAKTQQRKTKDGVIILSSIADEYAEYGLRFDPANNDLLGGINRVNEAFKAGKLKIMRNCEHTIDEVSNWKWRKLKPGVIRNEPEEPMDKDNHTCDNLRYLLNARAQSPIKPEPKILKDSVAYIMLQQELEATDWRSKYR